MAPLEPPVKAPLEPPVEPVKAPVEPPLEPPVEVFVADNGAHNRADSHGFVIRGGDHYLAGQQMGIALEQKKSRGQSKEKHVSQKRGEGVEGMECCHGHCLYWLCMVLNIRILCLKY